MIIIGIATTKEAMAISAAGYEMFNRAYAMSLFDMELDEDQMVVVVNVDCDPVEGLWPSLCMFCAARMEEVTGEPGLRNFSLLRCPRCGSEITYSAQGPTNEEWRR